MSMSQSSGADERKKAKGGSFRLKALFNPMKKGREKNKPLRGDLSLCTNLDLNLSLMPANESQINCSILSTAPSMSTTAGNTSTMSTKKPGLLKSSLSRLSLNKFFVSSHRITRTTSNMSFTPTANFTPQRQGLFKFGTVGGTSPLRRSSRTSPACDAGPESAQRERRPGLIVRRHSSRLWSESVPREVVERLVERINGRELKRQEAIFELFQGERDLLDDFKLIEETYHKSLLSLGILDQKEAFEIFGSLHCLPPLHKTLITELNSLRDALGVFGRVGPHLFHWVPGLVIYEKYCSHQIIAKEILETKAKTDKRFEDFLERCLESPFSRRLNLWSLLDIPRQRLVKYSLLLTSIRKYTGEDDPDCSYLRAAIEKVEEVTRSIDLKAGEAECRSMIKKLEFDANDTDASRVLSGARLVFCSGNLKNGRGSKLFCILFDTGFVVTRPNPESSLNLLYKKPIPTLELAFSFGDKARMEGTTSVSHGRATSGPPTPSHKSASYWLRVYSAAKNVSFTLQANDEHSRKMWLNCLSKLTVQQRPVLKPRSASPRKRCSSVLNEPSVVCTAVPAICTQVSPHVTPKRRKKFCNENSFNELFI